MRRDLKFLVERVGPRVLVVAVVACAVIGAGIGAITEAVHQYGLPAAPKGAPPA